MNKKNVNVEFNAVFTASDIENVHITPQYKYFFWPTHKYHVTLKLKKKNSKSRSVKSKSVFSIENALKIQTKLWDIIKDHQEKEFAERERRSKELIINAKKAIEKADSIIKVIEKLENSENFEKLSESEKIEKFNESIRE
jgi:hypothetical protein